MSTVHVIALAAWVVFEAVTLTLAVIQWAF